MYKHTNPYDKYHISKALHSHKHITNLTSLKLNGF